MTISMSAADYLIDQCERSNPPYLQNFTNLSEPERIFLACDHCSLNESELRVLFESGKCLPSDYAPYMTLVYVMYGTILFLALPGNFLVVVTVFSFKKLHSVTHFFIANMAVGDLLVSLFCIPFSVVSIIVLQYWPFGTTFCIVVNYLQAISVLVSAYTLVAISIDRYMAIMYPLRPRLSQCQAKVIMVIVWALALLTTAPVAIVSTLSSPDERFYRYMNLKVCHENWTTQSLARGYTLALMLLQYFFPVVVLIVTYCRIACHVWGSSKAKKDKRLVNAAPKISGSQNLKSRSLKRTSDYSPAKIIRMTLTVVLAYSLCWLPFNVLQVIRDFWSNTHEWPQMHIVWFICHWLAVSHSCYNPLILCWMNVKFRKCLMSVIVRHLPCCCCPQIAQDEMYAMGQHSSFRMVRNASATTSLTIEAAILPLRIFKGQRSKSARSSRSLSATNCDPLLNNHNNQTSEINNCGTIAGTDDNELISLKEMLKRDL